MNMKKKFLIVLLILNVFFALIYFNMFEATAMMQNMEKQADDFINHGSGAASGLSSVTGAITTSFSGLGQILTFIGAGVMAAATSYMGIMYLISPPDKQAALKQQLIGLLVSGIVIFGAYGIWKLVIGVVRNF